MVRSMRFAILMFSVSALLASGCKTSAGTGALAGGALGTGVGALVGMATKNPKTGAVVGGLLGTGIGAAIGNEADEAQQKRSDELAIAQAKADYANAPQSRGPLSLQDVVSMSMTDPNTGKRVSDDVLIDYIRNTNSTYNLTPGDLKYLSDQGVSDRVIREMMATRNRVSQAQQPILVRERPQIIIHERPVFVAPPPPPPGIIIGGHFR
ncbi:MAG: glycine zipper domain-containing protein [Fimbriiglobus sp.]